MPRCYYCGSAILHGICFECQHIKEGCKEMSRPIGTLTVKPTTEETMFIKRLCGPDKPWLKTNDFILEAIRDKLENDPAVGQTSED